MCQGVHAGAAFQVASTDMDIAIASSLMHYGGPGQAKPPCKDNKLPISLHPSTSAQGGRQSTFKISGPGTHAGLLSNDYEEANTGITSHWVGFSNAIS